MPASISAIRLPNFEFRKASFDLRNASSDFRNANCDVCNSIVDCPLSTSDQRPNGSGRPWPRKKAATPAISASALSSAAARCFAQWASHSAHSSGVNSSLTQPFQNHTAHQPVSFSQQYLKTSASSKPFSVGT